MNDELLVIDDLENTLPVEEVIENQEENLEESLESPEELSGDETLETYETSVIYDDSIIIEQLLILNNSINKLNGLMAALLFFTVASWVLQKVHRGVKEVMYIDRDN